ncbi:ABC transporter substrate-binding protein [Patescibacteria group bacterium]|nr:ABC transporter substrate-binding protein [Patescibacteria group bacterium]MBU4458603.1 ABC transporter substrate-binding protein [Patescibacteria group bacterium]MCG2696260.1 ABC transporter substrate-binding protein [Candidatus Portnoybacteria bacterium]
MKKIWIPIIVVIIIIIAVAVFYKPASKGTIKIGFIGPLTGKAAALGERAKNGFLLASEELKGKGINLEVIIEDDVCLGENAVSAYRKIVDINGAKIIVGPVCSTGALAVAPLAEQEKSIIISTGSAAPSLSYAGDYVFRNHPDVKQELTVLFSYLKENYDYKNVAMVFMKDNDFSVEGEKFFRETLSSNLGMSEIIAEGVLSESDYRTVIEKLKKQENKIDVIMVDLLIDSDLNFLKQAKELGLTKPIVANKVVNNPDFLNNAGELSEGIIFTEVDFDPSINQGFWDRYKIKYGEDPNVFAAQSYESLMLLFDIIENKCKSIKIDCVKDELYKVKNWQGVTGLLSVDKNGDFIKNIAVKIIKGGKVIKLK